MIIVSHHWQLTHTTSHPIRKNCPLYIIRLAFKKKQKKTKKTKKNKNKTNPTEKKNDNGWKKKLHA